MRLKNTLKMLVLLACFSFTLNNGPGKSIPEWFKGHWTGTGNQVDGQKWDIDLTVKSASKMKINYPGLGCGGSWSVIEVSDNYIYLKETLKKGSDKCDQGVEIRIDRISDSQATASFFLLSYSETAVATAVLKKD
ncbi:MAG: hypothetical protein K0R65_3017 [Crocinitomicaceae bacterium]|jgi:hypothetical protein|nr:hypothetical protein [Crocinitomicaceae bacterium]